MKRQMINETRRRSLWVASDRATREVYVASKPDKTATSARRFLQARHPAYPVRITRLLTDNGKEVTDRRFASREREPSGHHVVDWLGVERDRASPDPTETP